MDRIIIVRKMKRLTVCWIIIAAAIITGCMGGSKSPSPVASLDKNKDVSLEAVTDSFTAEGGRFIFVNNSETLYGFGEEFYIEKKTRNGWMSLKYASDYIPEWHDIILRIQCNDQIERTYKWSKLYHPLDKGDYRIIVELFVLDKKTMLPLSEDNGKSSYVSPEFSITE